MSIADKITRLQNAKTAIANAITAKGGTVQSGDGFEDFSTDITTIPSGVTPTGNINITDTQSTDVTNYATAQVVDADLVAGNIKKDVDILGVVGTYEAGFPEGTIYLPYVTQISATSGAFYESTNVPEEINLIAEDATRVTNLFRKSSSGKPKKATLTFSNNLQYSSSFAEDSKIEEITFLSSTENVTEWYRFIGGSQVKKLKTINARSANSSSFQTAFLSYYLEDIRFVENTIPLSIRINYSSLLIDDSVVSIANGLNESATGMTLTLHSTKKERCSTIMGTVALDETQTYHVFTADASGTVTLEDFITNTKGWTLA